MTDVNRKRMSYEAWVFVFSRKNVVLMYRMQESYLVLLYVVSHNINISPVRHLRVPFANAL